MEIKEHVWRSGFQAPKGLDPKKVADILEKLPEITPAAVLEEAAKPRSPLHRLFTWDDTKAAHEYRLWQARRVIGALEVVYVEGPKEPVRYMHVEQRATKGTTRYATTHEILSNSNRRNQLLLSALRDLVAFRSRYAALSELSHVIPVIDNQIEEIRSAVGE